MNSIKIFHANKGLCLDHLVGWGSLVYSYELSGPMLLVNMHPCKVANNRWPLKCTGFPVMQSPLCYSHVLWCRDGIRQVSHSVLPTKYNMGPYSLTNNRIHNLYLHIFVAKVTESYAWIIVVHVCMHATLCIKIHQYMYDTWTIMLPLAV